MNINLLASLRVLNPKRRFGVTSIAGVLQVEEEEALPPYAHEFNVRVFNDSSVNTIEIRSKSLAGGASFDIYSPYMNILPNQWLDVNLGSSSWTEINGYGKPACGFAFRATRPGLVNQWEARWDGSCGGFNFNSAGWTVSVA
jgi:hypothetical protein